MYLGAHARCRTHWAVTHEHHLSKWAQQNFEHLPVVTDPIDCCLSFVLYRQAFVSTLRDCWLFANLLEHTRYLHHCSPNRDIHCYCRVSYRAGLEVILKLPASHQFRSSLWAAPRTLIVWGNALAQPDFTTTCNKAETTLVLKSLAHKSAYNVSCISWLSAVPHRAANNAIGLNWYLGLQHPQG